MVTKGCDSRSVTIGLHRCGSNYAVALESCGFRVSEAAHGALEGIRCETVERQICWGIVTPLQLGMLRGGCYGELLAALSRMGCAQLPAEAGPAIRLQYPRPIVPGCLLIASEPILHNDEQHLFSVCSDEDDVLRFGLPMHASTLHYDAWQSFAVAMRELPRTRAT